MNAIDFVELLRLVAPETIVLLTTLLALGVDLVVLRESALRTRWVFLSLLSVAGCVVAIGWMVSMPLEAATFAEAFRVGPVEGWVKVCILGLAIFTILLSVEEDFTVHVAEFHALLLLSAIGMMFLVSAANLLMVFIALELTSLPLYVLTGLDKRSARSAEAALKYFVFGSVSAAFTLFGLSLVYGVSGTIYLPAIAASLQGQTLSPLLILALVMTVTGFGFKIAAVPFHLWAPDVYQGAPMPSAAFVASGSKVASFFVLTQILVVGFAGLGGNAGVGSYVPGWMMLLAMLALVSMVLGNLAAIVQTSVRRLLAYSAIAHAGYMLLGIMGAEQDQGALLYYAVTYGLTSVGAFGVLGVVEARRGTDRVKDFAGLGREEPVVSFCMLIFMLSLAGIPPLAGFFGKFFVFASALNVSGTKPGLGLLWLVLLAIALSAVSLYYYLIVLKQIYVVPPAGADEKTTLPCSALRKAVLVVIAAGVILLGCLPHWLLSKLGSGN